MDRPPEVSFRCDVEAALTKAGCNAGTCHGSPTGKNGFRLSLRGYDPTLDYASLTRDVLGRRVDRLRPESSLMLLKALGQVPHGGGSRLEKSSRSYRFLHTWLATGTPDHRTAQTHPERLEVLPPGRELRGGGDRQQLIVAARFADGSITDVTDLAIFSSSDEGVAEVAGSGLVVRKAFGETAVLVRYLDLMATAALAFLPEARPGWTQPASRNFIDDHVFAQLRRLGIEPSPPAGDAEFLRRVALDVTGTLAPPEIARAFLDSKGPEKRSRLIDQLLSRPEYADFWALKWSDVLRASRPNMALSEVLKFQRWLRTQIAANTPFDRFARQLLTATDTPFDNPAVLFFRAGNTPEEWGEAVAQVFLGVRLQCARCHNHPFERWTQDDYYNLAAFFARLNRNPNRPENRFAEGEGWWLGPTGEQVNPMTKQPARPKVLGLEPDIAAGQDRRQALADLLAHRDNPYFARAAVNRIWFHLMGRGIVEPVDDFRDSNPPSNSSLLDALAADFVVHGFDAEDDPHHPEFANLPALLTPQPLQLHGSEVLFPCSAPSPVGRATPGFHLGRHGNGRTVRRIASGLPRGPGSRLRGQQSIPQVIRLARTALELHLRADQRTQPFGSPAVCQRRVSPTAAWGSRRADCACSNNASPPIGVWTNSSWPP